MISYTQALAQIRQLLTQPLATERQPLLAATGRILATALIAPHDMPPFDQSLMDGYALCSSDTHTATPTRPARLAVGATLTAGADFQPTLAPRQAVRIMTGAPIPPGADTVLKVEDSQVEAGELIVSQPLSGGVAIQARGAEIRRQTVLLRPGTRLTPPSIATALSLGLEHVEVRRRPRLALVAPGDELLPPGAPWQPGKKWCSNLYGLDLRAQELGCTSLNLGIVPDTLESLTRQLERGLDADIVVIIGASGRGDHDFATQAITAVGAEILFRGVAISPGRSLTVACHHAKLIFGLPGSPWAAFISFEAFVRPALRALTGQRPARPRFHKAALTTAITVRPGMTHLLPTRLQPQAPDWLATPLDNLLSLAQAAAQPLGLIVIPPHRQRLPAGGRVQVQPLWE